MLGLLCEGHPAQGVEGDDLAVVQADRGNALFAGTQGFTACKAHILQHKSWQAVGVKDFHVPVEAQQAHGPSFVALGPGPGQDKRHHYCQQC